jgi:putative selenate reductase
MQKAAIDFKIDLPGQRQKEGYRRLMINRMIKVKTVKVNELPLSDRKNFTLVTQSLDEVEAVKEASRCLKCDELCNTCVTVCPNLALYSYFVKPTQFELSKLVKTNGKFEILPDGKFEITQSPQILHIADWCNECGNCTTFCPTSGSPYKEKPHLYLDKEAFENNDDCYYYDNGKKVLNHKQNGYWHQYSEKNGEIKYNINKSELIIDKKTHKIKSFNNQDKKSIDLRVAAEMGIVWEGIKDLLGYKIEITENSH